MKSVLVLLLVASIAITTTAQTAYGYSTCNGADTCSGSMCCATLTGCVNTDEGDASYSVSTGYCIYGEYGFGDTTVYFYDDNSDEINCSSAVCQDPNNAYCLPVPYDSGSSDNTSECSVFGEDYCCMVPDIDGDGSYSDIIYGQCYTVEDVDDYQKDNQLLTCGAEALAGLLLVGLSTLF
mmetsp:Transcript_18237/g.13254  ORF Transcript_18237/g.13254 Transcript_18237/m.13254 type:complete len:180 (+) Transcript_18237:22-561(+)|eukprot:CAMPEP_0202961978 /NCGR_PEP_ID=MMETSP1396-20130829/6077_1 /ASSEMBLY_ACC=CAM_ASM_000872 /TAXON_ID= /ORGANISM="Pseudokeronopsis sp., Strain Brazil" /LENGTH=179 /DNA_ID=CAMNT_0049682235 /DNA_START=10 /DNA_END=549 /DNA_ORIENTATION=+